MAKEMTPALATETLITIKQTSRLTMGSNDKIVIILSTPIIMRLMYNTELEGFCILI